MVAANTSNDTLRTSARQDKTRH